MCNSAVRSSRHDFFFKVIHPGRAYNITKEPSSNESQTKYIFTDSLKHLLVSTRFKYPSSVCAQKEAKLEIN